MAGKRKKDIGLEKKEKPRHHNEVFNSTAAYRKSD